MPPFLRSTSAHELVGRLRERVVRLRRLDDPVLPAELALELPGAPSRIAREDAPRVVADDLVRLLERREAERAEERHGGVLRIDELAEDEHRIPLHRTAEPDLLVVLDDRLELGDELRDGGRRRAVENEPGGAFVGVLGDEDDGAAEVRVEQARRGDQELALQRVHLPHCGYTAPCCKRDEARAPNRGAAADGLYPRIRLQTEVEG
jgi:hypothetical protein